MSNQYVPALRRRFLEDMRIKGLQPKTQTMYLRAMRDFTRFLTIADYRFAEHRLILSATVSLIATFSPFQRK